MNVNKEGEVRRPTFLTVAYGAKEFHDIWSPGGQKLAFWLKLGGSKDSQFAAATLNTGEVTNYCIPTIDRRCRCIPSASSRTRLASHTWLANIACLSAPCVQRIDLETAGSSCHTCNGG